MREELRDEGWRVTYIEEREEGARDAVLGGPEEVKPVRGLAAPVPAPRGLRTPQYSGVHCSVWCVACGVWYEVWCGVV
jgi:hypothetical protein